jgi:hypothetical protein
MQLNAITYDTAFRPPLSTEERVDASFLTDLNNLGGVNIYISAT